MKEKLEFAAGPGGVATAVGKPKSSFSSSEEDAISALMSIGANRPSAEAAVLKAKQDGASADFETIFRTSLRLLR